MVEEQAQAVAETEEEAIDISLLEKELASYDGEHGAIIRLLQKTQALYGWLPAESLELIAEKTGESLSKVYGVATFYAQFYLERRGRHTVRVCDGTACHVRGAPKIVKALEDELGVEAGETTPDYRVTLEVVYCLGSCGLSPVAVIDDNVVGRLVPSKAIELVRALE